MSGWCGLYLYASRADHLLLDNQLGNSYQQKTNSPHVSSHNACHLPGFLPYKRKIMIDALVQLIIHFHIYLVKAYKVQNVIPFFKFKNPNTESINSLS